MRPAASTRLSGRGNNHTMLACTRQPHFIVHLSSFIILFLSQPTTLDPALVLSDVRKTYGSNPTADRVRLTIRPPGRAAFREDFTVRVSPASSTAPAAVLIELGDLRVYGTQGRVIAVSTRNQSAYFADDYGPGAPALVPTAAALASVLPPLPLPQLALAFSAEDVTRITVADFTAYTARITFSSAASDPSDTLVTLNGRSMPISGAGEPAVVTLVTDAATSRLRRFETRLGEGGAAGDTLFLLEFEAVEAGDPEQWKIDPGGRVQVAHLSDLRPARGDAAPDKVAPEFALIDIKHQDFDLRTAFAPDVPGAGAPDHIALLFVRDPEPGEADPPALAVARALLGSLTRSPGSRLASRTVLILPRAGADTPDRIRAGAQRLGDDLLWSASPETTINRFLPTASLGVVIIRADRTLACAIPVEPEADDEAPLRARIEACLSARPSPTDPPPP